MPDNFGDIKALFEKYQALVAENGHLKEEIRNLKAQLGILEPAVPINDIPSHEKETQSIDQPAVEIALSGITNNSPTSEKIRLFMSLFKGRDDVYAVRWENKRKGKFGYRWGEEERKKEGKDRYRAIGRWKGEPQRHY